MANSNDPEVPNTPPSKAAAVSSRLTDGSKNLMPINIEDEMRRSYLDYSMSVIIGRALPDVRDGLKPVHRRILYTMHEMGLHKNRSTKCAKIVGEAMGKYHPHGDSAIYDTLVRLAQDFVMRYPLVEGRATSARSTAIRRRPCGTPRPPGADRRGAAGGHRQGDGGFPAELRRERRWSRRCCRRAFPNLLVNGSSGIAVGMATNIPPHNLTEIVNAAILLVKKPKREPA